MKYARITYTYFFSSTAVSQSLRRHYDGNKLPFLRMSLLTQKPTHRFFSFISIDFEKKSRQWPQSPRITDASRGRLKITFIIQEKAAANKSGHSFVQVLIDFILYKNNKCTQNAGNTATSVEPSSLRRDWEIRKSDVLGVRQNYTVQIILELRKSFDYAIGILIYRMST